MNRLFGATIGLLFALSTVALVPPAHAETLTPKQAVQAFIDAENAGDVSHFPDFIDQAITEPGIGPGIAAFTAHQANTIDWYKQNFTNMTFSVDLMIAEGETVAVYGHVVGVITDGHQINMGEMLFATVLNGKITSLVAIADTESYLEQAYG